MCVNVTWVTRGLRTPHPSPLSLLRTNAPPHLLFCARANCHVHLTSTQPTIRTVCARKGSVALRWGGGVVVCVGCAHATEACRSRATAVRTCARARTGYV
jgi:hypothetical protein